MGILVEGGTVDVTVGTPIAISVEDEADIAAFSNFTAADASDGAPKGSSATPPPPLPPPPPPLPQTPEKVTEAPTAAAAAPKAEPVVSTATATTASAEPRLNFEAPGSPSLAGFSVVSAPLS